MQNGEVQLQMLINPLVENGKAIHKEIIQKLISSPNWVMLTANEKEIITNFSDVQFAELSIVFSKFQENITLKEDDTWSAVRYCLSGALGLGDLYYLLIENPQVFDNNAWVTFLIETYRRKIFGLYWTWIGDY
jgi:hypothetical protein